MPNPISLRSTSIHLIAILLFASACGPSDPLEEVRLLQERGQDNAAALELLREMIDEGREEPEVQYRYGLALIANGDAALAHWPLREAMRSPEWIERAGSLLAATYVSTGDYDGAIDACNQVLEADPENLEVLALRADARVRSRRYYEEALEDTEQILEIEPDHAGALATRTVAMLALGRAEEAGELLESLEGGFRDDTLGLHGSPLLCVASATFAKEKGELEDAEERFEVCLEVFPDDALVVKESLGFFDEMDRGARSIEVLEDLLEENPEAVLYRMSLVQRLDASGRKDEADALLVAGTEVGTPSDAAMVWSAVALRRMEQERFDDAAAAWQKARELDASASPELAFGYADALVVAGRTDEALAVADQLTVAPYRELVRGRAYLARGEPEQALERFAEGNRLWPNNVIARYYTAVAAEQVGDFERAIEEYRSAMRIDADATDTRVRLARIYLASGQDEHAKTVLQFMAGSAPIDPEVGRMELELLARRGELLASPKGMVDRISRVLPRSEAVAAIARGVSQSQGPSDAAAYIEGQKELDLAAPANAAALEALVQALAASDRAPQAVARTEAAAKASPDSAVMHAIHGEALRLAGRDARAAFERALELDEAEPRALAGLAALEAEAGNTEAALALYARHAEGDADERAVAREHAALLATAGNREEAEERLSALLREHPTDADAALQLAKLRQKRGEVDPRTRELVRRAVRFGGGEDARAFLAELPAAS